MWGAGFVWRSAIAAAVGWVFEQNRNKRFHRSSGSLSFKSSRSGCMMCGAEGFSMTPEELEFHKLGIKLKFLYSLVGLCLGLACIGAGTFLGINGVVGHTSWTASLFGLSTNINDAAPGVIVFIVGIFFVLITRLKIKVTKQGNDTDVVYQRKLVMPE